LGRRGRWRDVVGVAVQVVDQVRGGDLIRVFLRFSRGGGVGIDWFVVRNASLVGFFGLLSKALLFLVLYCSWRLSGAGVAFFALRRLLARFGLSCKALLFCLSVKRFSCLCFYCSRRLPGAGVTFFAAAKKVTKESSFFNPAQGARYQA
jgi:hypothetical protein